MLGTTYTRRLDVARRRVVESLQHPRDAPVTRAIVGELARSEEPEDRVWGLSLVSGIAEPWVAELALAALGDPDETVITEGQRLLGDLRPVPVTALEAALGSPVARVRSRALGVVAKLGVDAGALLGPVEALLDDPDVEVRWEASVTWARLHPGADLSEALLPRLVREREPGGHSMVQSTLLYALMHQPAVLTLLPLYEEQLGSPDRRDVAMALERIGALGPAAASVVPALERLRPKAACRADGTPCQPLPVDETLRAVTAPP